jgi:hypothetical protein
MQPIFNAQLFDVEHELSASGQRAYDVRTAEFVDALRDFRSQWARSHSGCKLWRRVRDDVRRRLTTTREATGSRCRPCSERSHAHDSSVSLSQVERVDTSGSTVSSMST